MENMKSKIVLSLIVLGTSLSSVSAANWSWTSSPDVVTTGASSATKVGIGNSAPKAKLTIGATTATAVEATGIALGSDQKSLEIIHSTSSSGYGSKLFGVDDGSGSTSFRIATRNNSSAWTDRFYMNTLSGNIGIGNTAPKGKLAIGATMATGVEGSGLVLGSDQKSIELIHSTSTSGYGSKLYGVDEGNRVTSFRIATRNDASAWTDRFYVSTATGNIGIGTSAPGASLDVRSASGDVAVFTSNQSGAQVKIASDGSLTAKRIITNEWGIVPDYVFENGYKLDSLKQVERYIRKHKHLPGIPGAKEMNQGGMDLAEMNMRLLRKVEELTLHSIEQEKRIEKLERSTK